MNASVPGRTPAPWHLWAIGIVGLCWNGYGCYDYVMSVTRNAAYLSNFPPEISTLLDGFPAWATGAWAIGVWASLLGSLLLLIRSRHAVWAFVASLAGVVVSFAYQLTLTLPPSLDTTMNKIMPVVIIVVVVAQWWYSRKMVAAGVLG